MIPAVKADGNALLAGSSPFRLDDFRKGLGRVADNMDIHLMESGTHGAAETGGAKGELVKESTFNLLRIVGNSPQLFLFLRGQSCTVQPCLISVPKRHYITSKVQMMKQHQTDTVTCGKGSLR